MPAPPDARPHPADRDPAPARQAPAAADASPTSGPAALLIPGALQRDAAHKGQRVALRAAQQPWASLARRARVSSHDVDGAAAQREGAHERWLRARLGLAPEAAVAAAAAWVDGCPDASWRLDPVHLHVGLDHLVLTDPDALHMTTDESHALAEAIRPLLSEESLALDTPLPHRWYLREIEPGRPLALHTHSLWVANGRSVEAYLPQGADARRWRRLVNAVQMTWFAHPVNRAREQRGLPTVNSLWIEGRCPPASPAVASLGRFAALRGTGLRDVVRIEAPGAALLVACHLLHAQDEDEPEASGDAWRALNDGPLSAVARADPPFERGAQLVLTGDAGWRELAVRRSDRWCFWRRQEPAALLHEPEPLPPGSAAASRAAVAGARA